ncbi:MAG: adenosylcobalamin-dependent ribonucleoside-diphosphate reductase [Gammaproteobacteria bacterium]|nr:adenosylcobalamin-dependent ribonucleoside-diphosphate reductase [Gammaproteobacteria bacterium]
MKGQHAGSTRRGSLSVPVQSASLDIWDRKYRLKRPDGSPVDQSVADTFARVARTVADVEETEDKRAHWYEEFLWALNNGAIPAGRILSNAGAEAFKPQTSTINCTVSGAIRDSMDDILQKLHEAGLTLKTGSGIGYEFSTLRPGGAWVAGAGARTSGPLSFMDIYDRMCLTLSSAGGRRGAQMATFDVGHPDVLQFVGAKRDAGRLRHFNLSLLITDEFIQAVRRDEPWNLVFPVTTREIQEAGLNLDDAEAIRWREWPITEGYPQNSRGQVACRIYRTVPARQLWDLVMAATYEFAEPGFVLIDRVNEMNNNWFCEIIRATNPCGEQPLPPYGACLLGSVNLIEFVLDPFSDEARFDWDRFRKVVRVFTRMLDNVVEISGLALPEQRREILRKRRHGMGFLGLGSALAMLRMRYGAAPSLEFTERVTRELAITGWREALALAREKGPAPIMDEEFTVTARMLSDRPEMAKDGLGEGQRVRGRVLHARYSRYMQKWNSLAPDLISELAETGGRFTHHTSIAPTGTISLSMANNASNGIEPSFAHQYVRNIIREGKKSKESVEVCSYELLAYRELVNPRAAPGSADQAERLPDYFVTAADVDPRQHVDIQAAAQKWVDSSISKTINVPAEFPFAEFKDIYLYACEKGLKGCATFRFNPVAFQGVLVQQGDLARTRYRFTLDDGEIVELRGDELVEYEGEIHSAANLHDALRDGYYGRY